MAATNLSVLAKLLFVATLTILRVLIAATARNSQGSRLLLSKARREPAQPLSLSPVGESSRAVGTVRVMRLGGTTRRGLLRVVAAAGLLTGAATGPAGELHAGAAATSYSALAGAPVFTLSDTTPSARLSVPIGFEVIVEVPKWS